VGDSIRIKNPLTVGFIIFSLMYVYWRLFQIRI
jgi:hypothetical protein